MNPPLLIYFVSVSTQETQTIPKHLSNKSSTNDVIYCVKTQETQTIHFTNNIYGCVSTQETQAIHMHL